MELGGENWMNTVLEKLKELLVVLQNFWASLIGKADEVFPPDKREEQIHHWLVVATPFLIAAGSLLLCICCCRCCCRGRGGRVRMMKAPGRDYRMPRHVFESNPRSYFRGLRGNAADELF
ncbi:hypothetical protein NMG60_11009387 [Bertholletia excelsa]